MHLNNSKLGPSLERNIPFVIDSNEISANAKTFVAHVWNTLGRNTWLLLLVKKKLEFIVNNCSQRSDKCQ
jgi:hypothetical protein